MTQKELIDFCNLSKECSGKECPRYDECDRYMDKYGSTPYLDDEFHSGRYTDEEI